jgi:aspartyl-tRNA(Asn)/glutamyl-tRNA(Gln) amidotransferase subunit A
MVALAPGFERHPLASLDELEVGIAWTGDADPLVGRAVEQAAARFPRRRPVGFPLGGGDYALFNREVADVHRGLFPEHADSYGDGVRTKIERCLRVTAAEAEAAGRARSEYRERCEEALDGLDLLLTPTIGFVPPRADVDELEIRGRAIRFTYPFDSLGWPALALPCGTADEGLPASIQLVGRPGDDARVLAAGRVLASLIRGTAGG